ncbi:hypothetical protein B0920_13425 [Massilia sp. KIM]|uniref:DciA family protein n=1 Tax=Massilia sp. KIM TaxID=1955422 RepID=UPI00098F6F6D|nr:DciA family protein [Massilia sp. KIM]OON64283.1 hypothetical protein B0920_13425 [Massilia sp. KIM]
MQFSSSKPRPFHIFGTSTRKTSHAATDFLQRNDHLASLLPAAQRMGRLQADCAAALPAMFSGCAVLSFQDGVLVLSVPSSALAARLKQMLPKLQASLQQKGWQVENIRQKIQMTRTVDEKPIMRTLELPPRAVQAFEELAESLEETAQNKELVAALRALAAKRKG